MDWQEIQNISLFITWQKFLYKLGSSVIFQHITQSFEPLATCGLGKKRKILYVMVPGPKVNQSKFVLYEMF